MAFNESQIETKDVNGYYFDYENYDCNSFSPRLYDDPLQTVPDLEAFAMRGETQNFIRRGQQVPQRQQMHTDDETTPVRIHGLFSKTCKITPRALNFGDDCSEVTSLQQYEGGEHNNNNTVIAQQRQQQQQQHDAPGKAAKKSKRRSYLSNDLPADIRNQRRTVANARERARVGRMANGYDALETALPKYLTKPKMRKVDILNSAVCHIQNLMRMLSDTKYDCNQNRPDNEMNEIYPEVHHQNFLQSDFADYYANMSEYM